ncbi:ABC transporter ATP-binding protein [Lacticaseibacillus daqingensis]|uniref:ABC transporter ATP-binding protein n=1 Tax=Lacticaseibacillus daqingensis TaxID=2486014 RepID=UPI000F7AE46A|nr:ATP-binding cassette domain-containing protein [Lacticaseibacillus daqingensis]
MPLIEIDQLTKDYGSGRGIFDINLNVEQGEVFGFTGTNGAGKTTTIRHLMGFLRPQQGHTTIGGLDCWLDSAKIKQQVGYCPGEIAFPDEPTGTSFLKHQAELLGLHDMRFANDLIAHLQLDPTANLKRMSKGMKQKTALVATFMADPQILILDEPTTGLDPLMRAAFIEIILAEKKKGKTIFMSSHMMDELEETCDRVALIEAGKIQKVTSVDAIKHSPNKTFKLEFADHDQYARFLDQGFTLQAKRPHQNQVIVRLNDADLNHFVQVMTHYQLNFISEIKHTLEDYFKGTI